MLAATAPSPPRPPPRHLPRSRRPLLDLSVGRAVRARAAAPTTTSASSPGSRRHQTRRLVEVPASPPARALAHAARRPAPAARWPRPPSTALHDAGRAAGARATAARHRSMSCSPWCAPVTSTQSPTIHYDRHRPRGLAALPEPSPGDLFLDLEGDPYVDGGLEYLFGVARSRRRRAALPRVLGPRPRRREGGVRSSAIDLIIERRAAHPGMHVYHYAPYEPTRDPPAHGHARHPRGRGRRPAPRRGVRRPLPGGAPRPAPVDGVVLAQAGREALPASARPAR